MEIDPLVKSMTYTGLDEDISIFKKMLNEKNDEYEIHKFLSNHSYFFNGILRLMGSCPLYSKVKLGNEFEMDFCFFDTSSTGPEWTFIEIESPKNRLFNKNGDPSAQLSHAIRQVQDWHSWIHENVYSARELMPYLEYPFGYIFIGRRKELNKDTAKRLKRINYDYRRSLEIHTLDWFVSSAKSVKSLINNKCGGNWYIPMKALTHRDLRNGLPYEALRWMNRSTLRLGSRFPKEMLEDRDNKHSNHES